MLFQITVFSGCEDLSHRHIGKQEEMGGTHTMLLSSNQYAHT